MWHPVMNSSTSQKYPTEPKKIAKKGTTYPSFMTNLRYYISEFCQSTSLHGLKFLGEKRRSTAEKCWWFAILAISLCCCTDLIYKTYIKWQKSPVIVNFATSQTPIWQIPFPAITICPETKTDRRIFNYTEIHLKRKMNVTLSSNETELYQYMTLLCANRERFEAKFVNEKVLDFITEVAPTLNYSLWHCKWMGDYKPCSKLFIPVITEVGVCFSFNILDRAEMFTNDVYSYKNFQLTTKASGWSPIVGYTEDDNIDSYPQRALFSSAKAGLSVILETTITDVDHLCGAGMQGYKVHVHHPTEIPSIDENYFRVSLNEAVIVAIKPKVMHTHEKLFHYKYDQRKCYFSKEKPLRFFKIYNQQNCQTECLTNFTLKSCGCVAFHMPRVNATRICGPANKRCMMHAEGQFLTNQVSKKIRRYADDIPDHDFNITDTCDCLPSCVSTRYDEEISQTPWEWKKFYDSKEFRRRIQKRPTHNSKLIIFFKERQIMTFQRNELYGYIDFIANCGGLLGLFVGFSFISLMELIYFLSLRLMCNLRMYGSHLWAGNEEIRSLK